MSESPNDRPVMTIAPDGYIPRGMQLQKVERIKNDSEIKSKTPTSVSNALLNGLLSVENTMVAGITLGAGGFLVGSLAEGNYGKALLTGLVTGAGLVLTRLVSGNINRI